MIKKLILLVSLILGTLVMPKFHKEEDTSTTYYRLEAFSDESEDSEEKNEDDNLIIASVALLAPGDCTIIKRGDLEILIDCGGNKDSGSYIYEALKKYCTDGVLEYVIITHGDSDHTVNFFQKDTGLQKFLDDTKGKIGVLIDFDVLHDRSLENSFGETYNYLYKKKEMEKDTTAEDEKKEIDSFKITESDVKKKILLSSDYLELQTKGYTNEYSFYVSTRNEMIREGTIEHYYTASQVLYGKRGVELEDLTCSCLRKGNDNKTHFKPIENFDNEAVFSEDGLDIKILDSKYNYKEYKTNKNPDSLEYNILAVNVLLTFDGEKFLFTGDLQEYDGSKKYEYCGGETDLLERNEGLKDGVLYYKAGHHGSRTSSSFNFLRYIRPSFIAIETVAGLKYGNASDVWPNQDVMNVLTKYTDYIWMTNKKVDGETTKYYGDIEFVYNKNGKNYELNEENSKYNVSFSEEEPLSIFESEWYKENRSFVVDIYDLTPDGSKSIYDIKPVKSNIQGSCTYIKAGHLDILINMGVSSKTISSKDNYFLKKVEELCNDKVLDVLIITDSNIECYSEIVSECGLVYDNYFKKIKDIYYPSETWLGASDPLWQKIIGGEKQKSIPQALVSKDIQYDTFNPVKGALTVLDKSFINISIPTYLETASGTEAYAYSIPVLVRVSNDLNNDGNLKTAYLNVGHNYCGDNLAKIDISDFRASYYRIFDLPNHGGCVSNEEMIKDKDTEGPYKKFLKSIKPDYYLLNATAGFNSVLTNSLFRGFVANRTYATMMALDSKSPTKGSVDMIGDLDMRIYVTKGKEIRTSIRNTNVKTDTIKNGYDIKSKRSLCEEGSTMVTYEDRTTNSVLKYWNFSNNSKINGK